MSQHWIALCRPGFEDELSQEAQEQLDAECKYSRGTGWVMIKPNPRRALKKPWTAHECRRLVFARQLFMAVAPLEFSSREELVSRAAAMALKWVRSTATARGFKSLFIETPDSEAGYALLNESSTLQEQLEASLRSAERLFAKGRDLVRLHMFIPAKGKAWLGVSNPKMSSPWAMGIPRFILPAETPSRSARKLEEAIALFIPKGEIHSRVKAGMRAVDLGAAPGGWSWTLTQRGLVVTAVDNAGMDKAAMATGLITHVRADGFTYRPDWRQDWLVCDMVAGGSRVVKLVGNWLQRGHFNEAIFNLKLGGSNRLEETARAKTTLRRVAKAAGTKIELSFKHLYHDRDEITCHIRVTGKLAAPETVAPEKASAAQPARGGAGRSKSKPQVKPESRGRSGARAGRKRGSGRSR